MKLPYISHLQFVILDSITYEELSGEAIRKKLSEYGKKRTMSAFHQLMQRLEEEKLVKSQWRFIFKGGRSTRMKYYKATDKGAIYRHECLRFYEESNRCHS